MRAPIPPRPHPDPSRADEPGPAGDTEDVGLPAQVSDELVAAGLAVGEPMGRDRSGRLAPRRALDPDGRDVVVQIVDLSEKAAGARTLRRLADLRSLRNDAIAPVRQVLALPGNRVGVVSDLIAGADLAVVLGARGGLTRSEAARLLDDLGGALAHMHERGMAHGDVAAANVIVSTDGRPVLIDLLGGVLETGTPASAAPERKAGAPATAAADVYSLAALLRQCAAGSPALAERLERVLPDALDPDPAGRPSARDLAARAPEIGLPGVIELPDGARLAAGALRAASSQPTRAVASRRGGACDRRPVRRWGRRSPSLPRRRGARLTLAVLVLAVAAGGGMGDALDAPIAADEGAAPTSGEMQGALGRDALAAQGTAESVVDAHAGEASGDSHAGETDEKKEGFQPGPATRDAYGNRRVLSPKEMDDMLRQAQESGKLSPLDNEKVYLLRALQREWMAYANSEEYKNLPNTALDATEEEMRGVRRKKRTDEDGMSVRTIAPNAAAIFTAAHRYYHAANGGEPFEAKG